MSATILSPIRAFQAFMAHKNPHSWCGGGIKSPTPIARPKGGSEIIDNADDGGTTAGETSDGSHVNCREGRSPP